TDLFAPILQAAADLSPEAGIRGYDDMDDLPEEGREEDPRRIALRVVADHVRTLVFAITDGAQPSNTGRGYVIRRILRRAVRYGYQGLGIREPFLFTLAESVIDTMGEAFPDIAQSRDFVTRVIRAEEQSFLRTLSDGIEKFEAIASEIRDMKAWMASGVGGSYIGSKEAGRIEVLAADLLGQDFFRDHMVEYAERSAFPAEVAFLLHDTYGFPSDLTAVMAREQGLTVDEARFEELMQEQRDRARAAGAFKVDQSQVDTWDAVHDSPEAITFVGYDALEVTGAKVLRTRASGDGDEARFELVLDRTPFYAESGGQVGDTGTLTIGGETIQVLDTQKGADGATVHIVDVLPGDASGDMTAMVDATRRTRIMRHHTATHLLHRALRETLGDHVQQKGSLVAPDRLRFDFSHYEKVSPEAIAQIERRVNEAVLMNLPLQEERGVPIEEAKARGAMALFGEKYGDAVRVISFTNDDDFVSVELCGGTHVPSTAEVG
ncbi:MAG: alanine--tRNA ligase-related protein, partial [Bacteroidota bacterium]